MDERDDADCARELERLKRSVFGLKDTIARQSVELQLLRQDIAAAYGLLRLLVDKAPRDVES